jgi:fructokinase
MFLVVGESLVDLISEAGSWRFEATPGGSPLNVAVGLSAAGQRVRLASEVGDDLFGELVRDHLTRHEVADTDLVPAESTSLAFARVDADGVASYDFRFGWRWSASPSLDEATCLHVGSLAAVAEPGAAAVRAVVAAARARGLVVSYDPNVRPSLMGTREVVVPAVTDLVSAADIVKVSAEDLAWLYPDRSDVAAAAGWAARGPRLVVVTRGGDGAVALHQGYETGCAAPEVEVVDTVGAGDAFTAGLLAGLATTGALAAFTPDGAAELTPDTVAAALRQATATAAAVCGHRGAAPAPPQAVAGLLSRSGRSTAPTDRPAARRRPHDRS